MPREKRIWIKDRYYHIVCRGNRRDTLFFDDKDFITFLYILYKINEKTPFEIASYCLMTNHFHLQMKSSEESISKIMALVNKRYANYFNNRYHLTGHVFEKRFFGKLIDCYDGMLEVSKYIHLNPLNAGIVKRPEEYPWSSFSLFCEETQPLFSYINISPLLESFYGHSEYEKKLLYIQYVGE